MSSPSSAPPVPARLPPTPESTDSPVTAAMRAVDRQLARLFRAVGFEAPSRWFYLLAFIVLIYGAVTAWVQVEAYQAFFTYSQDFGSINQAMNTAAFHGRLFYYTSNLPAGTNGSFFAVHFAPILFLLVPFYGAANTPVALLVFKALVVSWAAFPIFGLARRRLGSPRWGFVLGVAYLFSPLTVMLNWTGFDLEVFFPLFALSAFYFAYRERYLAFLAMFLLALSTIETVAPFLAVFAFLGLVGSYASGKPLRSKDPKTVRERWAYGIAFFIALLWLGVSDLAIHAVSPNGGTFGSSYGSHYTVLGADSLWQVFPQALLHPSLTGAALQYAGADKLVYVAILLGSLAFLPLFGEFRYSIPAAINLAAALLSNFVEFYTFGSQYIAYLLPFLFAASIGGIAFLRDRLPLAAEVVVPPDSPVPAPVARARRLLARRRMVGRSIGFFLLLAVLVTVLLVNPYTSTPLDGWNALRYGYPTQSDHDVFLHSVLGLVPREASVLTTAHVFPEVSGRVNAFVLPFSEVYAGNASYWGYLNQFINASTFVLMDFTIDPFISQLMEYYGNYTGFGTVASAFGIVLLERGWTGGPLPGYWPGTQEIASLSGEDLVNASGFGPPTPAYVFAVNGTHGATIWSGPTVSRIPPGLYQFTVHYSVSGKVPRPGGFTIEVLGYPLFILATEYLASAAGHHYLFTIGRNGTTQTLNSTAVPVSAGVPRTGALVTATATVSISSLETVQFVGLTAGGTFTLRITEVDVSLVGSPTTFTGG